MRLTLAVFSVALFAASAFGQAADVVVASGENASPLAGFRVALSSERMAVTTLSDESAGTAGSVAIYRWDEGTNSWVGEQTISSPNSNDLFGWSVAIDGDALAVGAVAEGNSGAVHIYRRNADSGLWDSEAALAPAAEAAMAGCSIALSGDVLVIGAMLDVTDDRRLGAAYVYRLVDGQWTYEAKLLAEDAAEFDAFGSSVDIDGTTILVGAPEHGAEPIRSGAAYVFTHTEGIWAQTAKLMASDAAFNQHFGGAVSLSGTSALIGAPCDGAVAAEAGAAYLFTNVEGIWSESQKITASDATPAQVFGKSVSLDGGLAAVGAPATTLGSGYVGATYVFTQAEGSWAETSKLSDNAESPSVPNGSSVAVSADVVVTTSGGADTEGENASSAQVYQAD